MRILSFAACCGLCLALAAGCGSQQGAPAEGKLTIAVIPKSMGAEFWENVKAGAEEACQEMDVEMKWEGPLNENELADQNKIIENMVNLHVAGIALAPLNPKAMRGQVENAVKAGIPVVIFDSAVDGDAHTSFVATNNRLSGEIGGRHVAELVGGKGRVMVMRFIQGTAST
jgi:ribose transport system substrate-binding protein